MYYIAAFIGLVYEWVCRRYPIAAQTRTVRNNGKFVEMLFPATASIVVLFLLRLALIHHAAIDERAPQWLLHLPITPIYDSSSLRYTTYRQEIAFCLALISVACCIALFIVYRTLEERAPQRREWIFFSIACAIMSVSAVAAPSLASTDPYFYAAYGELGFQAYGSRQLQLPCPISQADPECMRPAFPNVYGPLYTTYLEALLRHIKPIFFRIELLRISNAVWVLIFFLLLRALNVESSLIAIATLNSAILMEYIADAHNDVIAIDLILIGALLVRRLPFLTLLLVTGAALIKLPFVLFGAFAFQRLAVFTRSAWATATIIASVMLSLLWGGETYIEALSYYNQFHNFFSTFEHRAIALAALIVMVIGFVGNRFGLAGAYTLPALGGGSAFPWYSLWAIPYLLQTSRSNLAFFFITLPMTSFLMETPFLIPALWCVVILALTGAVVRRILTARDAEL